jgi:hypothetical protein
MAPEGVVVSVASVELKLPVLDILAAAIVVHACPPNVMVTSPLSGSPGGTQPEPVTVTEEAAGPVSGLTATVGFEAVKTPEAARPPLSMSITVFAPVDAPAGTISVVGVSAPPVVIWISAAFQSNVPISRSPAATVPPGVRLEAVIVTRIPLGPLSGVSVN